VLCVISRTCKFERTYRRRSHPKPLTMMRGVDRKDETLPLVCGDGKLARRAAFVGADAGQDHDETSRATAMRYADCKDGEMRTSFHHHHHHQTNLSSQFTSAGFPTRGPAKVWIRTVSPEVRGVRKRDKTKINDSHVYQCVQSEQQHPVQPVQHPASGL
jgi:hypothetical protein